MSDITTERKASLIYDKWQASLSIKQRDWQHVQENFDELWDAMSRGKVPFDVVFPYLEKAGKAHHPNQSTGKFVYSRLKRGNFSKTFDEWFDGWKKDITDMCKLSFYSYYTIDDNAEPEKRYGQMSAAEYKRQRAIADSFEEVSAEDLAALSVKTE